MSPCYSLNALQSILDRHRSRGNDIAEVAEGVASGSDVKINNSRSIIDVSRIRRVFV